MAPRVRAGNVGRCVVGDLALDFEAFDLPGDEGRAENIYTAPPRLPHRPGTRPARQLDRARADP